MGKDQARQAFIVNVFDTCFGDKMEADPPAWQKKFRKMSASPFTFYRGSAALFYSDMEQQNDTAFLNEKTSRVWIHGDLHACNFGTYMNSEGLIVFDINDFDEAFVGPFIWDLKRLSASLMLLGYEKALSDDDIKTIIDGFANSYADQVKEFVSGENSASFALTLENTEGTLKELLLNARLSSRLDVLDMVSEIKDYDRQFNNDSVNHKIDKRTKRKLATAFKKYLKTIPKNKQQANINYDIKDIVETKGVGIGSAGYKIYTLLLEGPNQALENDIVISMKQGQVPSPSRVVRDEAIQNYFKHNGHRTVVSQRALQAFTDPWLGYTELDGIGMVVAELSAYNTDLEWDDINTVDEFLDMVRNLGKAVAKIHCVSDIDSDQSLVPFSTDAAILEVIAGKETAFSKTLVDFGMEYGERVRADYNLFVDAFRNRLFKHL